MNIWIMYLDILKYYFDNYELTWVYLMNYGYVLCDDPQTIRY